MRYQLGKGILALVLLMGQCSPAAANVESASYDWNQGGPRLTLTGFEQGTYSWTGLADNPDYHMVDLLYFDVHYTTTSVDGGIQSCGGLVGD